MHETASIASQPQQSSPAALANEAVPVKERELNAETDLVDRLPVQLKLSVGAPNDPLEHEADSMADKVMRMPDTPFAQRKSASGTGDYDDEHVRLKPLAAEITPFVQRCTSCNSYDDDHVHLKSLAPQPGAFASHRAASDAWVDDYDDEHVQLKPQDNLSVPFIQRCACDNSYDEEHVQLKLMTEPAVPFIQRCACDNSYDDEHVQLKPSVKPSIQTKSDGASTVNDSVSNRITSSMGGGSSMDKGTKSFMESRFGTDFSAVKIHNGEDAADFSKRLNAKAFTIKNNVYFNNGQYQPETDSGKRLLAHELTHVIQQNGAEPLQQMDDMADGAFTTPGVEKPIVQRAPNSHVTSPAGTAAPANVNANPSSTPTGSTGSPTASAASVAAPPASAAIATAPPIASKGAAAAPTAKGKPVETVDAEAKVGGGEKDEADSAPALTPSDNPGDVLSVLQKTPVIQIAQVFKEATGVVTQSEELQKKGAVDQIPAIPEAKGSPYGDKSVSKSKFKADKANASAKNVFAGKGEWQPPVIAEVAMPAAPAYVPSNLVNLFANNPSADAVAATANNELDSVGLDESSLPDKLDNAPTVPLTGEADANNVNDEKKAQADEVAGKKATAALEIDNDFGENDVIPKPGNKVIKSKQAIKNIAGKAASIAGGAAVANPALRGKANAAAADHINAKIGEQTQKYANDNTVYQNKITEEKTNTDKKIDDEIVKSNQQQAKAQVDAQGQVSASRVEWQKRLDDTELDFQTKAGETAQTHLGKIDDASKQGNDEAKKHYDDANADVTKKKAEAKQEAETKKSEAKNESKGFLGWLADKASALIDGLKKAVNFIFDKLRAAVKWAFEQAKKLAMAAIELARNIVVGLIKAFGEALKVLVDVVFASFPEIRDEINGKIDKAVDKAVSIANEVFDAFKEAVSAIIDAYAAIVDAALAIIQKSIDIGLTITEGIIVVSLKILDFLTDIEKQYNAAKEMIDNLLYLWDNPQVIEDKAHEFLASSIENVPEGAKAAIRKALDAVGLGAEKHFNGVMKYLMPALMSLKANWWQQAKDMVWFLIWPFGKGSPLYEDAPKLWHLLPQMWNDFTAGEYSKVVDGGLEWMQALNSTLGAFAGWFAIGGALVGAILGGIFGAGGGAIPGAGAGFEAGVSVGEGIMVSMLATESLVIAKAAYDLSVTDDDGIESPEPEKKTESHDDSETKNEPQSDAEGDGNEPNEKAPRNYVSGDVKTGHDRIMYAYQRIATSGLTLGIMLAFMLLGAIGGKIAKAIVSGIKMIGKVIGELAPELTSSLKGVARAVTESKPVKFIESGIKAVKESKTAKDFNEGRNNFKNFKKKIGFGKTDEPTVKSGDKTPENIGEVQDTLKGHTDTEPVKVVETDKPVEVEKPVDKPVTNEPVDTPKTEEPVTETSEPKTEEQPKAETPDEKAGEDFAKKAQNDEDVVSKVDTEDGHKLKADKDGHLVECSECKVYEISHREVLDENPDLAAELKEIRKEMTINPDDPAVLKKLEEFDTKLKDMENFAKAEEDLLNDPTKIDDAYKEYRDRKAAKKQKPRAKEEWLDGKLNKETGNRKGGYKNTLKGRLGEYQADVHLQNEGFKKLNNDGKLIDYREAPQGKGLDGVWEKDGDVYVTETKYGTSKLTKEQMTDDWIRGYLKTLDKATRERVEAAMENGNLKKMLVNVDNKGVVTKTIINR